MSLKTINAKLAGKVELVRGEGYHYFVFEQMEKYPGFANAYNTRSHYIPYTNMLSEARWVELGLAFFNDTMTAMAEEVW